MRSRKEVSMRGLSIIFLLVVSQAVLPSAAVTIVPPPLPAPAYADRETSSDTALPPLVPGRDFRIFRLSVAFVATASNNVQVAFFGSEGEEGSVSAETTCFIASWDCGAWILRPEGLTNAFTAAASARDGRRELAVEVRVDRDGTPVSASFHGDGAALAFPGFSPVPVPAWLAPRWRTVRVTSRGADAADAECRIRMTVDGTTVVLK
jgi:hypothetical protein